MLKFLKGYLAAGQIAVAALSANFTALLVAPFITRLYAPANFGTYSTFIALTFVDVVACLGFEKAVVAVHDDAVAHRLARLSIICALAVSLAVEVAALAFHLIASRVPQDFILMVMFLPLSVFLVGVLNALFSVCVRELQFGTVAIARIIQALALSATQLAAASLLLFDSRAGLVVGQVVGTGAAVAAVLLSRRAQAGRVASRARELLADAREHVSYVYTVAPALLFNSLALQAPILLVGLTRDVTTTGLFGLTQRIAGVPMALLGIAVGQVFAGRLSQLIRSGASSREATHFYFRSALMMVPVAVGLWIVGAIAPDLFALVFGREWEPAGHIFRYLLPLYSMQVVVGPLQSVFFLVSRHDLYWKAEALRLLLVFVVFGCAAYLGLGIDATFMLLGTLGALGYATSAVLATYALRHARIGGTQDAAP